MLGPWRDVVEKSHNSRELRVVVEENRITLNVCG